MAAGGIAPRWKEPAPVDVPAALRDAVGGPPVLAETLVRRGYDTPERARAFLDPRHYRPAPPADLPDMACAADRIERALRDGERIGVWGDFDVDGQTSTTLLVETLRRLGADPVFHIPVRATESHGVGVEELRGFLDKGVTLMLTCDTGVDATESVEYAAGRGVDVIITDHHDLPEELPPALAVINPKRIEGPHPLRALPGVGVAFQVARELFGRAGRIEETRDLLDLVALGVVADLAEQVDDTRFWAAGGVARAAAHRTDRPAGDDGAGRAEPGDAERGADQLRTGTAAERHRPARGRQPDRRADDDRLARGGAPAGAAVGADECPAAPAHRPGVRRGLRSDRGGPGAYSTIPAWSSTTRTGRPA